MTGTNLLSSLIIYLNFCFAKFYLKKRRQQYVGRALFSQIDTESNRVYLATDQNVLTALNLKTGNIG